MSWGLFMLRLTEVMEYDSASVRSSVVIVNFRTSKAFRFAIRTQQIESYYPRIKYFCQTRRRILTTEVSVRTRCFPLLQRT